MKKVRLFNTLSIALIISALTSCGLPTAAVRTLKNALNEAEELSDGTSSAYKDVN